MKSTVLFFLLFLKIGMVSAEEIFLIKFDYGSELPALQFVSTVSEDKAQLVITTGYSRSLTPANYLNRLIGSPGYYLLQLLDAFEPESLVRKNRTLKISINNHNIEYLLQSASGETLAHMSINAPPEALPLQMSSAFLFPSESRSLSSSYRVFDLLSPDVLKALYGLFTQGGSQFNPTELLTIPHCTTMGVYAHFRHYSYNPDWNQRHIHWRSENYLYSSEELFYTRHQTLFPHNQQASPGVVSHFMAAYMVIVVLIYLSGW